MTERDTAAILADIHRADFRVKNTGFIPSIQQEAVFFHARTLLTTSAFVEAVAGAGKTTTLVHLCKHLTGRKVAFLAYNKKIADEIGERLNDAGLNFVLSGTFHSVCFRVLKRIYRNVDVKANKVADKFDAQALLDDRYVPYRSLVIKLVSLAKQRGIGLFGAIEDRSIWFDIVDHYDLNAEVPEDVENFSMDKAVDLAQRFLKWSNSVVHTLIDFDDMIYIPLLQGMKFDKFDDVLIDEAQDTNPVRRAVVRAMLAPNGRAFFVGDRHQAIYGFTGADNDAIDQIIKEFDAVCLPLTVTYRCPKAVVEVARTYVSHIEAHASAPAGIVRDVASYDDFAKEKLKPTDVILCRNTAPIVELAFSLIRRHIACKVEGRDIGDGLLKLVNKWKSVKSLNTLIDKLNDWRDKQVTKLVAKKRETAAAALNDRVDTLIVLTENVGSIHELIVKINELFVDTTGNGKPILTLSTVHKAKGREWDRVFLLGQDKFMPSPWARMEWQKDQENNLIYVAYTRAKRELVFVPAPPPKEKKEGV